MKNIKWIDDLKLRVGYGVTGNNNFSSTYMANMLGSDAYWLLPNGNWKMSYGKSQNVNPDLGWEQKKEWNFGIDYSTALMVLSPEVRTVCLFIDSAARFSRNL